MNAQFALHPQLAPLLPLYRKGRLAVVHAVGSPHPTRSHFDAQDYLETATPGNATLDGWLNRYLALTSDHNNPFRAIALRGSIPRALVGRQPVLTIDDVNSFGLRSTNRPKLNLADEFRRLYASGHNSVFREGRRALEAAANVREALNATDQKRAAAYPPAGQRLRDLARLLKAGFDIEIAWVEFDGWDTHTDQRRRLRQGFSQFSKSIAAFYSDLGARMRDIVVLTMTEFGRTVGENGSGGTDHGHASVMFLLGGEVRGGRVHGVWPGLGKSERYEGRDLAVTTDFRQVLGDVVTAHLGLSDVTRLFPGLPSGDPIQLIRRS